MRSVLLSALAVLALVACSVVPETPAMVSFEEPATSDVLTVRSGGEFTLELSGNVTTGYVWSASGYDEAVLSLLSDDYRADPAPPGLVGSGGTRVFTFLAESAGETEIVLIHARHPEDVVETRTLTVQVQP